MSKTRILALRRRWEAQIGEHGLDRAQAHALLADLDELAGTQTTTRLIDEEPAAAAS